MKIATLGAGMIGRTIAKDLASQHEVTVFDISEPNLELLNNYPNITTRVTNLQHYKEYPEMLAPFDMVACAVPGFMGFNTLKAIIEAGKNVVDISFSPENLLELDALAKENNITAIVDCGVAPGISNLILGRYNEIMKINRFECMVGGLPKFPKPPFNYKAPFSPVDIIEEYTRPARFKRNNELVTMPALTDIKTERFDDIGELESFNTDGLRSILITMPHIPNMVEKTLRYPGHVQLIENLIAGGFFSEDFILAKGLKIRPLDVTTALLFQQWKPDENEPEFTVMKIVLNGKVNEKDTTIEYLLYDEFDQHTNTSSMGRTTAFTCTAAVNMIAQNKFNSKGIFPPELIGKDEACFDFMMNYLAERKVKLKKEIMS